MESQGLFVFGLLFLLPQESYHLLSNQRMQWMLHNEAWLPSKYVLIVKVMEEVHYLEA